MTTAAMVLGVVPLIIAGGAGAAARYSMGLVIFTGMPVGTIFTLFVVPMFYTYISRKELKPQAEKPDGSGGGPLRHLFRRRAGAVCTSLRRRFSAARLQNIC